MLWFGGHFGDKHVALRSTDEGEFRGILPRAGTWRVQVEAPSVATELSAIVSKTDDGEASVDLDIPDNHVSGVVVDSTGTPYRGATITLLNGPSSFSQQSDRNGQFHFDGVPPGSITMSAEAETSAGVKSSNVFAANIGGSETLDSIRLKLADGQTVHCRVMGRDGPVIGAEVTVRPGSGLEQAPSTTATTDPDGVFDARIAAGFEKAQVVVAAPGYPLRVFEIPVEGRAMTLNLPQGGGTLAVTVPRNANGLWFFQDGRFLSLLDLFHWLRSHGAPLPDSSTFRVGDLAPVRYKACTLTPDGRGIADMTRCAEGFLPPYGDLRLTIP